MFTVHIVCKHASKPIQSVGQKHGVNLPLHQDQSRDKKEKLDNLAAERKN